MNYLYKLFLSFLLTSLPPLVILTAFFYVFSSNIISGSFEKQARAGIQDVESQFSEMIIQYKHSAYSLATDPELVRILESREVPERGTLLTVYQRLYSELGGNIYNAYVHVLSSDGNISFSSHQIPALYSAVNIRNREGIFEEAGRSGSRGFVYMQRYISPGGDLVSLSICKPVESSDGMILGYVIIDILKKHIIEICMKSSASLFNDIVVLENRRLISFDFYNPENDGDFSKQPFLNSINRGGSGSFPENGKIIAYTASREAPFTLAGIILLSVYMKNFSYLLSLTALVFLFGLTLSLFLAVVIARGISRPIHALTLSMEKAQSGDFSIQLPNTRKDEIGRLYSSFNTMIRQIRELMKNEIEKERQLNVAELKALQAQINPHFLYNSLNAVKSLAKLHDVPDITTIVTRLGQLLRSSIQSAGKFTTVGESLELIRGYLDIQQIRFQDKITVEFDVPDRLLEYSIPKLILQPFVENAVVHGLEQKLGSGLLSIRGRLLGENLEFQIIDDGPGFDTALLDSLDDDEGSIGIQNVHRRIQLYYGEDHGVNISSISGEGTTVTITVPAGKEGIHE